ncbi:YjiH family protein [Balneolaceae bacterium ANBcel3]|nr:YjiH family protein [Balneolaceae bacterium ANBcel3]
MSSVRTPLRPDTLLNIRNVLRFLIPSLAGITIFLIPFRYDDTIHVGMSFMAGRMQDVLGGALPIIAVTFFWISMLVTLWVKFRNPNWASGGIMHEIFHTNTFWLSLRIAGTLLATMTLIGIGPSFIISEDTGGLMLNDLITVLFAFFFFAALCLPFLVDYGFMEFIGSMVRKPFRWLFNLPGRSAIDATASWFGSGTVGVLITMQQYEKGFYSKRESAVIATNFSIVSIAFSLVVINFVDLNHMFIPYYGTVVITGLITAIILPRIYPLSRKPDTYYEPVGRQLVEEKKFSGSFVRDSLLKALERAHNAPGIKGLAKSSFSNLADILLSLLPLVYAIGIMALIIAEYTPLFTWLSWPVIPLLALLQIPEAAEAAPAVLIGFTDMFLPAILASGIESEFTRFVIAALSISQLIYMSEVGALILKSKIPLNLLDLIVIFLLRTLISLPIITLMAHLFFF